MDTAQVLQSRRAAKAEPQWRPLFVIESVIYRTEEDGPKYLCKQIVDCRVQHTSKQLIAHEDGEEQIADYEGTRISSGVVPDVQDSQQQHDSVNESDNGIEFTVAT